MLRNTLLLLAAGTMAACSSSNNSSAVDSDTEQSVSIPFAAVAGDTAITCDATLTAIGSTDTQADVLDFKFYVHDLELIAEDDTSYPVSLNETTWQNRGVALLDFTDRMKNPAGCDGDVKETNTEVVGTINASDDVTISGVRFTIGVPADLNHLGRTAFDAGSILTESSMDWSWQAGHKHMRLDVDPADGALTSWNFHLGTTGCTGGSESDPEAVTCTHANLPTIELDDYRQGMDVIEIDYAALVTGTNITVNTAMTPNGCMSNPPAGDITDCQDLFERLGMDYLTGNAHATTEQSVFSIR